MKPRVAVWVGSVCLLAGALISVTHGQPPPTDIPAVDTFIDAPRALFGRTRAAVERALGAPATVRGRTMAGGLRTPVDPIDELTYPGVVVGISRAAAGLRRVEISEARWPLPSGLNVGVLRGLVEQRLGEPQASTDASVLYLYSDGYPNTVEFTFAQGRVRRIEWLYAPAEPLS